MAEYDVFSYGGVQYPLTTSLANALVDDADPVLKRMVDFFAAVIHAQVGARFVAQSAAFNYALPNAVMQKVFIEPKPFLLADQFQFPALFAHRSGSVWSEKTLSWDRDLSEVVLTYLLPPWPMAQRKALEPILRAVDVAIHRATKIGRHSAYQSGAEVWKLCGLAGISHVASKYDGMEPLQGNDQYYRALVCTFQIIEREMPDERGYERLSGATISVGERANDATVLEDVAVDGVWPPPQLLSLAPASGSKAGGTAITLTGTDFRAGTRGRVVIGGAECSNVVVASSTQVTAVTPPHNAYPSAQVDAYFIAHDGQYSKLAGAFTFTTP